jgi:hypothetical protein
MSVFQASEYLNRTQSNSPNNSELIPIRNFRYCWLTSKYWLSLHMTFDYISIDIISESRCLMSATPAAACDKDLGYDILGGIFTTFVDSIIGDSR